LSQQRVILRREDTPIIALPQIAAEGKIFPFSRQKKTTGARRRGNPSGRPVPALTCKNEIALLADYLSSSLSPRLLEAFEKHIGHCPDCAAFLQTYRKTIEVTRNILKNAPSKFLWLPSAFPSHEGRGR